MKTFSFEQIEINETKIPRFSFQSDEFFRIEINFSLNPYKSSIIKRIIQIAELKGFKKIDYVKKQNFIAKIFKPWTVKYYLTNICNLGTNEVVEFFKLLKKHHYQDIEYERLDKLDSASKRVVLLRGILNKERLIVIDTAGMYVSALIATYKLIKKLYDQGGSCLEITYPPFSSNELDEYLERNVENIIIGESKI